MSFPNATSRSSVRVVPLALAFPLLGAAGCGDSTYVYGYYPYGYPVVCEGGTSRGSVDTDAILELTPGEGVGATVEYSGDGAWRFAVTCDSLLSGYACDWTLLVGSIDGTIDAFEPEELELDDVLERYPTVRGSTEEDGVILFSYSDVGIDAFTVLATPGAGMRVSASIGGSCGGPFLYWTDEGRVRTSPTDTTDLFPSPPGS